MKTKLLLIILILVGVQNYEPLLAQNYAQDTVWTRKTDQSAGMFQVKFSDNDSIIWAMGLENSLFFDALTGNEIKRIPGNNEVFFINNDNRFIRLNQSRTKFEIFDSHTFLILDTLENDGVVINEYPKCDISDDGNFLAAPIPKGFRIWDLNTKQILKTKIFPEEEYLVDVGVGKVDFICGNNNIITQYGKRYLYPGDPNPIEKTFGCFMVFDFLSLDSIDSYANSRGFIISNTCKYIAYGTGDPTYGVEVYDFNTKQLIWKIPVNGPSLTGIEFSPDDRYLVTSGQLTKDAIKIWSLETGNEFHKYWPRSYDNVTISHDGKFVLGSLGSLYLFYSRFNETPVIDPQELLTSIFPNPSTGLVSVDFTQTIPEITSINLMDLNGVFIRELLNNFLEPGPQTINLNVSDLANGTYFINVNNSQLNLVYKLIINR